MACNKKLSLFIIILSYCLLYYPYPNNPLLHNWMFIGPGISATMLFAFFSFRSQEIRKHDLTLLSCLTLLIYTIHQFEEHGIDFYGEHYAFLASINEIFNHVFTACHGKALCPLNQEAIFYTNTSVVWLTIIMAIWAGEENKFAHIGAISVVSVNAIAHIMPALFVTHKYNPGLFTAVTIFIPYSIFFYRQLLLHHNIPVKTLVFGAWWSILMHLWIVGSAVLIYHESYLGGGNFGYAAGSVIMALIPVLVSKFTRIDAN